MVRKHSAEKLIPFLVFGAILLIWERVSWSGLVNPILLPAPSRIFVTTIMGIVSPSKCDYPILNHAVHTLMLLAVGYTLGALIGIGVGTAVGLSTVLHRAVTPILGYLMPIPGIAWVPVAMIWIGLGAPTIIAVVAFSGFAEVIYNTAMGIRSIPKLYIWQMNTFGASLLHIFRYVFLPAAFPKTLAGLRLGLAASWRTLIGAEMFAGVNWGLGYMLYEAEQFYSTEVMFSSLLIVAAFGLIMEQGIFRAVERYTLERWGMERTLEA